MYQTYDIETEPRGDVLTSLLAFCASRSTTALLVIREKDWLNNTARRVLSELEPHLLSKEESSEWPGTRLLSETATVLRYSVTPGFVSVLRNQTDALYQWQQPERPEDLCFLRQDGTTLLVTITHESDAYLELEEDEYREIMRLVPALRLSAHSAQESRNPSTLRG